MITIQQTAERGEGSIRTAVSFAIEGTAQGIDYDALTDAVHGDDEAAWAETLGIQADTLPALETALGEDDSPYDAAVVFLLLSGAGLAAKSLSFKLGMFSPEVGYWSRQIVTNFATTFASDAAVSALETIRRQRALGVSPDQIARAAIRALSLTPNQAASLDAFQAVLGDILATPPRIRVKVGDEVRIPRSAVDRAIRKHAAHLSASQRSVLRKLLATEPAPDAAEALIDREAAAMTRFRLAAIGRQESMRAVNAGQHAAHLQGIREGHIPPTTRRFWVTAGDERVRHSHAAIPGLNTKGVGIDEAFTTPIGPVMFPPLEINCRCGVSLGSKAPPPSELSL